MKLAIINGRKGVEVHGVGCADIAKSEKRNHDAAWVVDADTRVELSHMYWEDILSDTHADTDSAEAWAEAESLLGEFKFLPCCKLPRSSAPTAAPTSCWVGYRVADRIMNICRPASIAAKLDAATPTKCADRTVRLTAYEVEQLRAFCLELEGEAGMMAYSARSLRKRLS